MFDWLGCWIDGRHIFNGLLTDLISIGFEALIIVRLLEWRKRREDNRRLHGYRQRTRKLLRRSLGQNIKILNGLLESSLTYRSQVAANPESLLPAPELVVGLLAILKRTYDDLSRDYVSRLALLDDPTREILDSWLEQVESLFGTWPILRLIQAEFLSDWGRFEDDSDCAIIRGLQEAEIEIQQLVFIAQNVDGALFKAETQRGGDEIILKEASDLRNGSHYWLKSRSQVAEITRRAAEEKGLKIS